MMKVLVAAKKMPYFFLPAMKHTPDLCM